MTGSYYPQPNDEYDRRPRCRHRTQPSEPYGREGQHGHILRVTPADRGIPAHAFIDWGDFATWEKLSDLLPASIKE